MKKSIFFILAILIVVELKSQIYCLDNNTEGEQINQVLNPAKSISTNKTVRLNFHFIRKDAYSNFTESSDGMGNNYNGYDFTRDLVNYMNYSQGFNIQMNIPSGNTTPVLAKNFNYVIDAVYFHNNPSLYSYNSGTSLYNLYGTDKPNVMNVFITCCSSGGWAPNTSQTSSVKFTESGLIWKWYRDWVNGGGAIPPPQWAFWTDGNHLCHEIGHLLGLNHTVLFPNGAACPTNIGNTCGDDCGDTPSAADMIHVYGSSVHPHCGFNNVGVGCSNNLMDYSNYNALTPCQIEKVHSGLENGLNPYTTCYAVSVDNSICDLGYPKLSHFGRNVIIGGCSTPPYALELNEKVDVYFSQSVEFFASEFTGSSQLEVIFENTCNF
ncbi:MAG: hypothetical protein MH137_08795 [Flavobacteriales bacterium]|nr:hypothetical protein [Flavobacteriales bacterium]